MSLFVVDASIAIKWFIPEVHSEEALRLLRSENTLFAPDLLWAETGNILWKKRRRGELTEETALSILRDLHKLPLHIHGCQEISSTAWDIARSYDRSFYGSLYLALAHQRACPLVTADGKLFSAVRDRGSALLWVEDVPEERGAG